MPAIGPDDVLIKVGSVGVCASDVHYYRAGAIGDQVVKDPIVLGHEFSGTVAQVGGSVGSLALGDRVAVEPSKPCGKCDACDRGNINVCRNVTFFGTPPVDGCLREYVSWPADLCVRVGDAVSLDEAAMAEPLAVGVWAAELAEIAKGETAAILGAGAIGLSVLQAARVFGAGKVVVTDPIRERREIAERLGADLTLDPEADDVVSTILDWSDGGADMSFECAGMPDAVWQSVEVIRPKSRAMVVGIPEKDEYCFPASVARRRETKVQFVRRSKDCAEKCVRMIEANQVDVRSLATHVFPFDESESALKLAMEKTDGVIRAVIRVSNE